jgi:hypothetical protein
MSVSWLSAAGMLASGCSPGAPPKYVSASSRLRKDLNSALGKPVTDALVEAHEVNSPRVRPILTA